MLTITKKLDISPRSGPHSTPQVINVSQYDSDFEIQFKLYASTGTFTIEEGTTAAIKGTKPSGTGYSADASIDIETKTVTVSGDVQMTAAAGRCIYEIALYKDNKEINSANFILLVERAALDADTITDESVLRELGNFDEAIEIAQTAATEATESAANAAASASAAAASAQSLVIDGTLTQTGQAADAKAVGDKLTPLIGGDEQVELTGWVYGKWINTGSAVEIGDTVDITSFTDWYSLKHVIVECQAGDKFLIDITGAANARAYAFLTSNNVLISRSDAGQAISGYITAPQNAGKVIIQGVYRQSTDDTTTDNGKAYKIVQGSGNVVRFDIAQDKTEAEKAIARANIGIDSLEGAYISYDSDQELTDKQIVQAQKNIGLIETISEKVDLFTTVPIKNQIILTLDDVNIGDKLLYHVKMSVNDLAYIAIYNAQDTICSAYGRLTYSQELECDGEFYIPDDFSYAKWIINTPNAQEFILSKVVGESNVPIYGENSVRYDIDQDLTSSQKTQAQKNIGLIETVQGKEDLITTVPVKNQILFTSSDVNAGDTLLYHIKMTIDDMAYIALYNSQNTIIAVYGKYTYGQTGNFDGEFQIPAGFSYAKWIINTPNAQEFILSKPVGELNVEIYARDAIRYDVLQDLSDSQKARARANIGVTSGGEIDFEEPFFTDVPMLYVTGTLPTAKSQGELPVMITYKSRTSEFTSYATLKVQGDSTSALPKKNFTIKMFEDSARAVKDKHQFKNWSKYNKFVIKANYHDITHARNVVGARVWSDMVKSRSDYDDLPTEMLESDNLACIDGFPVMMYVNGQYYGRYAFNLTKDNMLNMDDSNPGHAMVQGQGYDAGTRFEEPITTNWSDELTDDLTHVETRWKEVLSFVGTSSDVSFKANLGNYFSVPSLIDFYLFGAAFFSYDSYGKNQSYLTYDGNYFICSAYDMDLTVGLHSSGHLALGATEPWLPYYGIEWTDNIGGHNSTFTYIANRLFWKLATLFDAEIKARWAELRAHDGALSFANIDKRFVEWCSLATTEQMAEDYASTTANGAFTSMANVDGGNVSTNNIRQIVKFMYDRLTYLDLVFAQNS